MEETEVTVKKKGPGRATGGCDMAADLRKSKLWYSVEWLLLNQVSPEKKVPGCCHQSSTILIWKKGVSYGDIIHYSMEVRH